MLRSITKLRYVLDWEKTHAEDAIIFRGDSFMRNEEKAKIVESKSSPQTEHNEHIAGIAHDKDLKVDIEDRKGKHH